MFDGPSVITPAPNRGADVIDTELAPCENVGAFATGTDVAGLY
jgi:hypothetical protein